MRQTLIRVGAAIGLVLCFILLHLHQLSSRDRTIRDLQNQVAQRDRTIELKEGLYRKATLQSDNLSKLLDGKDRQIIELTQQVKKEKERLLAISQASVRLRHDLEATVQGKQTEVPGASGVIRKKVEFSKDFGMFGADGYTLTDPAEAFIRIRQNRPLRLTMALSQSPDGRWNSYVTSSEADMTVDIGVTAVNPRVLERRWYARLGLGLSAGMGSGAAVGGASLLYDGERFELGPSIWTFSQGDVRVLYGATFVWRPFSGRP